MATWTMDQYNSLCAAIAGGILIVKYSDKTVQYRSLSDMITVKNMIEDDLGIQSKSNDPFNHARVVSYSKE